MAHIVLPQRRRAGDNEETIALKELLAKTVTEEIEKIAKREATKNNFDLSERNGLFRAMAHVMSRPELLAVAHTNARKRLEDEGKLQKEDPAVVKHQK